MAREKVEVREVGLRDGLQLVRTFLATEHKLDWCRSVAQAGMREVEVTSFVPPSVLPQFGDAAAVLAGALAMPGVKPTVLVPNLKGAQLAFDGGAPKVTFVLSASDAHNLANVRRTVEDSLADLRRILDERARRGLAGRVALCGAIATSFGCAIQGGVAPARVVSLAAAFAEAGVDEVMLADTVGYGDPGQVKALFQAVGAVVGGIPLAAHFHDTRGLGLANVVAALEVGIRRFDAALAGLGGCPFAPGATGNINTEDTVFLLESLGLDTGIAIEELVVLRRRVETWLPGERFAGAIYRAGLPKTFRPAAAAA